MHGGMIHRPITVLHCTRTVELRGASGRSAFYWYSMNIGMEACAVNALHDPCSKIPRKVLSSKYRQRPFLNHSN